MDVDDVLNKVMLDRLYNQDKLSISQIAKRCSCSYWKVWRTMDNFKMERRSLSDANKLNMLKRKKEIPLGILKDLYINKKMPCTQIAKKFNCHHKTVLRKLEDAKICRRPLYEAMNKYPKQNFSGNFLEKAYLIGFRLGDLYVKRISKTGKTIKVECSSTKDEQLSLFENLFKNYGHIKKYAFVSFPGETEIRIYTQLNDSFNFLLKKDDKIEAWILNDVKYFLSFLAGYTDAEGCIRTYNRGNSAQTYFGISSYDKTILNT